MKVRPIAKSELDRFARMPGSDNPEWVEATLRQFWQNGMSRSAWCYIAEHEDGTLAGRVAYWAEDSEPDHRYLLGLHLPWDEVFLPLGCKLIGNTLALQRSDGAAAVEYYFYEQYDSHTDERRTLMDELGFETKHEKWRYEWNDPGVPAWTQSRLAFRPCSEAGTSVLRDLIKRAAQDTLDIEDARSVAEDGAEAFVDSMMGAFEALDNRPGLWQVALGPGGEPVGFVVPQKVDDGEGTINHIGVVPEHRGNRYVDELLARGTAVLQSEGFRTVVAETHQANEPMLAALERGGYTRTGAIWSYVKNLLRAT